MKIKKILTQKQVALYESLIFLVSLIVFFYIATYYGAIITYSKLPIYEKTGLALLLLILTIVTSLALMLIPNLFCCKKIEPRTIFKRWYAWYPVTVYDNDTDEFVFVIFEPLIKKIDIKINKYGKEVKSITYRRENINYRL